jgi:serine protease Do
MRPSRSIPGRPAHPGATGLCVLLLAGMLAACSAVRTAGAQCDEPIPEIFSRASPAVVSLAATSINPYRLSDRVRHVAGSGFFIDAAGLILTNAHVVFNRQSIRVTLDDGTEVAAELVGADPIFDVAVVRIPKPTDGTLTTIPLGDSDRVRVGEDVVAIGNPLGLDQTLTRGVVSALNRILPETPLSLFEPLLNRCGEVVGITTSLLADAQNISFAVPINLAKAILPSLLERGRVVRPWIGFHGQLVDDAVRDLLRIPLVEGLLVEVIEPGSPAERAGLRGGQLEIAISGREFLFGGDIVTTMNGTRLTSDERLLEAMRAAAVGDTLRLTVYRRGEYLNLEYVLPERPLLPGDVPGQSTLVPSGAQRRHPARPPLRLP